MNIREELLKEKIQSRSQALKIAEYVAASPKHFKELMSYFLSNEYRLAQRAAWSVSWAAKKNPSIVEPYIKELVAQLSKTDVHDAVKRNSLRILQHVKIPKALHGELMNKCFALIESNTIAVAIKAFALTTLFNLYKIYPEIKTGLQLIIEERWNHESIAFKQRAKKILAELH